MSKRISRLIFFLNNGFVLPFGEPIKFDYPFDLFFFDLATCKKGGSGGCITKLDVHGCRKLFNPPGERLGIKSLRFTVRRGDFEAFLFRARHIRDKSPSLILTTDRPFWGMGLVPFVISVVFLVVIVLSVLLLANDCHLRLLFLS